MPSQHSLLKDDFEYRGLWWLPNNPELQLSGEVKFTHSEYILLEISVKSDEQDREYFEIYKLFTIDEPPIIHGLSDIGAKITLYKVIECLEGPAYVGYRKLRLYIHYIFVGKHFFNVESLKFSSMKLNLTYLEKWMCPRFERKFVKACDSPKGTRETIIRAIDIKEYETKVEKIDAKIKIFCGLTSGGGSFSQMRLSYLTNLSVESKKEETFDWFEDKLSKLQHLFTLLVGIPVYPTFVRFYGKTIDESLERDVQLFYIIHNSQLIEEIQFNDMLTTFPKVENHLSTCIEKWFIKSDSLQSIYMLFFATLSDKMMYMEQRFLSRVQALESFHRTVYGNDAKYVSDSEYENILNSLKCAIPEGTNDNLKKKLVHTLKHGNQFSLRTRLKQLINFCWEECFENFTPKKSRFIQLVTDTRNYLTHLDDETKGEIADGIELYLLNERLKYLLFILFLNELDIQKKDVYSFLKAYKGISKFSPNFHW